MNRAGEEQRDEPRAVEMPHDHYIALRPWELLARLADHSNVTIFEREQFRQLGALLAATIHHEYRTRLVADVVTGKLDVRAAAAAGPTEDESGDVAAEDVEESAEPTDLDEDSSENVDEVESAEV